MAILNAANEVAVDNFLNRRIKFTDIPKLIDKTLQKIDSRDAESLETVLADDARARKFVNQQLDQTSKYK